MTRFPHELREESSQVARAVERRSTTDHQFGRLAARDEEVDK
jgi:hypothetical protein